MVLGSSKWDNKLSTPTYNSWKSMRQRILFSNSDNHKTYKKNNISICDEWVEDYDQFCSDMGERPFGTTLDRIDGKGNYEPSNCRWASHKVQQNNKDTLTKIEHNGIIKTIGEWAFELELSSTELSRTYKRYSTYGCRTFDELFSSESLLKRRVSSRTNNCKLCARTESTKWRKYGELCNTCYHQALRWSKKETLNIEEYPRWKDIEWKTTY